MPRAVKLFLVVFTLAFASSAFASGLWSKVVGPYAAVKAYFSSGTGSAPTDRNPDGGVIAVGQSGISLANAQGLQVTVETLNGPIPGNDAGLYLDGGTLSAGTLQAYLYDPSAGRWARAPDLDLTVTSGLAAQSFTGFQITQKQGRIAYVPSGLGQPVNVYLSTTSSNP